MSVNTLPARGSYSDGIRWLITPLLVITGHVFLAFIFLYTLPMDSVRPAFLLPVAAPMVVELSAVPASSQSQAIQQEEVQPNPEHEHEPAPPLPDAKVKEIPVAPVKLNVHDRTIRKVKTAKPKPHSPVKYTSHAVQQRLVRQMDNSSEHKADSNSAPRIGAVSDMQLADRANWQSTVLARLQKAKRYPLYALRTHQQDRVLVRFTLDKDGNVLDASIVKSQGYTTLDQEALALIKRVSPLPKPPVEELKGQSVELIVPVDFVIQS